MSKTASLNLTSGSYTIDVQVKSTRLPCEKKIWQGDRVVDTRKFMVEMKQAAVTLTHRSGDMIRFTATTMGSKVGCTKTTSMPRAMVVNKLATGPDMVPTNTKPESFPLDRAKATVERMTGLKASEVAMLFNAEALIALENAQESA